MLAPSPLHAQRVNSFAQSQKHEFKHGELQTKTCCQNLFNAFLSAFVYYLITICPDIDFASKLRMEACPACLTSEYCLFIAAVVVVMCPVSVFSKPILSPHAFFKFASHMQCHKCKHRVLH